MAKTLDQIVTETLGLKEMVICRLQWQIEDLKQQLAAAQGSNPAPTVPPKE